MFTQLPSCSQKNLIDGSGTIFIGKSYRSFGHLISGIGGFPKKSKHSTEWISDGTVNPVDLPFLPMESYLERMCFRRPSSGCNYCLQKLNLWRILHTKRSTMHYMFHRKYEGKHPFYRTPVISGSMTTWTWMTTHKSCGDVCKYEVGKLLVSNGTERSLCIQDNKNCAGSLWNFNGWYCRCIHIYICGDILYVLRYLTLLTRVAWSLSPAARTRNKNILDGEGFWEERPVGTIL